MKKQLLTTTALVVAGALVASGSAFAQEKKKATKPVWTLGGGWEITVGGVDQDRKAVGDRTAFDVKNSTEVYFQVNHALDNGIKIKGRVELEGQTSTDQVDESWFAVSGAFGEIRVGSEDPATDLMVSGYSGSMTTDVGYGTHLGLDNWLNPPSSGFTKATSTEVDAGAGDAEKISYFTPRIEGFQLGASYMPSATKDRDGSMETFASENHDGWAVAANFDRTFDKVGIGIAAGYVTMELKESVSTPEDQQKDPTAYTTGIRIKFAGATVSAGYGVTFNGQVNTTSTASEVLSLGANYKWGANAVSIAWQQGEADGDLNISGEDELDYVNIAYARTLGPGVAWRTNVMYADYDGEDSTVTTDDADGWAIVTGIKLSF